MQLWSTQPPKSLVTLAVVVTCDKPKWFARWGRATTLASWQEGLPCLSGGGEQARWQGGQHSNTLMPKTKQDSRGLIVQTRIYYTKQKQLTGWGGVSMPTSRQVGCSCLSVAGEVVGRLAWWKCTIRSTRLTMLVDLHHNNLFAASPFSLLVSKSDPPTGKMA